MSVHSPNSKNKTIISEDGPTKDAQVGTTESIKERDKALRLLDHGHNTYFDPRSKAAKKVLRKIDMRITPLIFAMYLLQLADKNSLSFAAIMGIREDTDLTPSEYSWLGSIVYFGYIAGEIPAAYLMQRVPLRPYMSVMMMIWGIVVAMHAVCHTFASLAVIRFILGLIEVRTAPVAIYLTGIWYTTSEQVTRVAIWYSTSGWAACFGGFMAWALNQARSFKWQGLFVLYGALTFSIGLLVLLFLASSPTDANWLSEEEKIIALERVRGNKTGSEVWKFNASQLKEAFVDVRFYLVFILLISLGLPNGGVTAFGPSIIEGFGFDVNQSTLLNMGSGGAQGIGTFIALFVAKRTNRITAGLYTLVLSCVGVAMMLAIPEHNYGARYGGYVLTMQFPLCVMSAIAFITGGVGDTTKKFAFGVAYQLGYAVGNIMGPQTYRGSDAPQYYTAKYTMLAFLIISALLLAAIGLTHKTWNARRNREKEQTASDQPHLENEEFADFTDFQLRSFRYPT